MNKRSVWSAEEMQAVAARTLQLRESTYKALADACIAAQKELLPPELHRISDRTVQMQNLGPKFRELCNHMRTKSAAQLQLAIDVYKRKAKPAHLNGTAKPKPAEVLDTEEVIDPSEVEIKLSPSDSQKIAESLANPPEPNAELLRAAQQHKEALNPAKSSGIGSMLEQALIGAMAPVIDNFMQQMRAEVRSAFERVQEHYAVQMQEQLRSMLHTELASMAPGGVAVQKQPRHNPEMAPVAPSTQPRYRIIVFHILDSQLAVIRDAMRQKLSLHKVELLAAESKQELYRMHTPNSYVIYIPKFSNHLPPDYEQKNVKKMLFAKGMDTIRSHITDILNGIYD